MCLCSEDMRPGRRQQRGTEQLRLQLPDPDPPAPTPVCACACVCVCVGGSGEVGLQDSWAELRGGYLQREGGAVLTDNAVFVNLLLFPTG